MEAYAIAKGENQTEGCAGRLINAYIPRWGYLHTLLSDRGAEFVSKVCRGFFKMLVSFEKYRSSYHPPTNGIVERLNHALCQMLSYLITDAQTKWNQMLLHAKTAHKRNLSRSTGLAPNEVHIDGPVSEATDDYISRRGWGKGSPECETRSARLSTINARPADTRVNCSARRGPID